MRGYEGGVSLNLNFEWSMLNLNFQVYTSANKINEYLVIHSSCHTMMLPIDILCSSVSPYLTLREKLYVKSQLSHGIANLFHSLVYHNRWFDRSEYILNSNLAPLFWFEKSMRELSNNIQDLTLFRTTPFGFPRIKALRYLCEFPSGMIFSTVSFLCLEILIFIGYSSSNRRPGPIDFPLTLTHLILNNIIISEGKCETIYNLPHLVYLDLQKQAVFSAYSTNADNNTDIMSKSRFFKQMIVWKVSNCQPKIIELLHEAVTIQHLLPTPTLQCLSVNFPEEEHNKEMQQMQHSIYTVCSQLPSLKSFYIVHSEPCLKMIVSPRLDIIIFFPSLLHLSLNKNMVRRFITCRTPKGTKEGLLDRIETLVIELDDNFQEYFLLFSTLAEYCGNNLKKLTINESRDNAYEYPDDVYEIANTYMPTEWTFDNFTKLQTLVINDSILGNIYFLVFLLKAVGNLLSLTLSSENDALDVLFVVSYFCPYLQSFTLSLNGRSPHHSSYLRSFWTEHCDEVRDIIKKQTPFVHLKVLNLEQSNFSIRPEEGATNNIFPNLSYLCMHHHARYAVEFHDWLNKVLPSTHLISFACHPSCSWENRPGGWCPICSQLLKHTYSQTESCTAFVRRKEREDLESYEFHYTQDIVGKFLRFFHVNDGYTLFKAALGGTNAPP
jgi:hypothetical protein